MKNIGILTYHNALNYGAVLQCYALQQTLNSNGFYCEVIDYRSEGIQQQYSKLKFGHCRSLKHFIAHNLTCNSRKKKKKKFEAFLNEKINLSKEILSLDELSNIDCIIVGSDQVWNPVCNRGDSSYLLSDLQDSIERVAYAASIGKNENLDLYRTKYNVDYIELLKKFSFISLREKDSVEFFENKNIKAEFVVDPVFLCERNIWNSIIEPCSEDYIFVYNLGNYARLFHTVRILKKMTGLKVKIVNQNIKGTLKSKGYEELSNSSPKEFVSLLSNAKYVVTDSFHATAFSLIFHKTFYTIANPNANSANNRLQSLLSELGLEKRLLHSEDDFDIDTENRIDFNVVDKKIDVMACSSLSLLLDKLNCEKSKK